MTERPEHKIETSFEEHGSLPKPGFVGRLVRLLFGLWLVWALWTLVAVGWAVMVDDTPPRTWQWWAFMAFALWFTPYVVNIGFTKNWRRGPQFVVLGLAVIAVALDLVIHGTWWAPPLGFLVCAWLIYFSAHLGISFAISALLGTPGCEMRAIPHLWTLMTGHATKEHHCPGLIDPIDKWEARRS